MKGRIFAGAFLAVAGIIILVLGILFLIASDGDASRTRAGTVMSVTGVLLFIPGFIFFRGGIINSPGRIKEKLHSLAGKYNGKLSQSVIEGALGTGDAVTYLLKEMIQAGTAKEIVENSTRFYIFEDFQQQIVMNVCPYCGSDYPVRKDIITCPGCGGDLRDVIKKTSEKNLFSMDE